MELGKLCRAGAPQNALKVPPGGMAYLPQRLRTVASPPPLHYRNPRSTPGGRAHHPALPSSSKLGLLGLRGKTRFLFVLKSTWSLTSVNAWKSLAVWQRYVKRGKNNKGYNRLYSREWGNWVYLILDMEAAATENKNSGSSRHHSGHNTEDTSINIYREFCIIYFASP